MEYKELLTSFAAGVGLNDAEPDEDGVYRIDIDDMTVSFRELEATNELLTWGEIGDPPVDGCEQFYQVLLESMFMGQGTGGSIFSFESESRKLVLHRVDSLQLLDVERFNVLLEKFVNVMEQWRKLLEDFRPVSSEFSRRQEEDRAELQSFGTNGFMQV